MLVSLAGCGTRHTFHSPLPSRAYIWQRQWTPAVSDAVGNLPDAVSGVVALGAELEWVDGGLKPIESNIDSTALRFCRRPAVALRIAPLPEGRHVAELDGGVIIGEAKRLIAQAQRGGVGLTELQLDFDCPARELGAYAQLAGAIRAAIKPLPLAITTLPAWLDSHSFEQLIDNCDRFVLQVHSIPLHGSRDGDWKLFDRALARKWITRAAAFGKEFAVALPTYRCLAGYAPDGRLLGIVMDSVQGRWPPDTRLREIAADPDEIADAVAEWTAYRPETMRELIWYRLPVASDLRNWRRSTFAAVVEGRRPQRRLEVVTQGENPVDIAIRNTGEADQLLSGKVLVQGDRAAVGEVDALEGWHVERRGGATEFVVNDGALVHLPPGETRSVGWVRVSGRDNLTFQIVGAGL